MRHTVELELEWTPGVNFWVVARDGRIHEHTGAHRVDPRTSYWWNEEYFICIERPPRYRKSRYPGAMGGAEIVDLTTTPCVWVSPLVPKYQEVAQKILDLLNGEETE